MTGLQDPPGGFGEDEYILPIAPKFLLPQVNNEHKKNSNYIQLSKQPRHTTHFKYIVLPSINGREDERLV